MVEARSAESPHPSGGKGRLSPGLWIGLAGILSAGLWVYVDVSMPAGEEALHFLNRWLVRLGIGFFLAAFTASSFATLRPSSVTRRWLRERRGIGLAWATVHLTHAAAILRLISVETEPFSPDVGFAGGTLGFVFTIAMAATSNDAAVRRLGGRAWKRLHTWGIRYLMFIYLFSYAGRVATAPDVWPRVALALCLGAIGLRIASGTRGRRVATTTDSHELAPKT